jgi:hypothetical protein
MEATTRFRYDPAKVKDLQRAGDKLCAQLEHLNQLFTDRKLTFEDVKDDFDRLYRPKAEALVEAMLNYTLHRIKMRTGAPNGIGYAGDRVIVGLPLQADITSTQLNAVIRILRNLMDHLPKK